MKPLHTPDPAVAQRKDTLNAKTPEFTLLTTPLRQDIVNTIGDTVNQVAAEGDSHATTTTPFVDYPFRYLRFRANFRDQVENTASLTDNEKMNYLMTYTYNWESEGSLALKW